MEEVQYSPKFTFFLLIMKPNFLLFFFFFFLQKKKNWGRAGGGGGGENTFSTSVEAGHLPLLPELINLALGRPQYLCSSLDERELVSQLSFTGYNITCHFFETRPKWISKLNSKWADVRNCSDPLLLH